jgi:plasmid maintenance system antidote protein VapI
MKVKINKQPTPTEVLRKDIRASQIPLTKIAKHVNINYRRFYLIVSGRLSPTHDEAMTIIDALPMIIKEEVSRMNDLQQRYAEKG